MRVAVVFLLFLGCILAQTRTFQAQFSIRNDSSIIGTMRGVLNYDAVNQRTRTDFFLQTGNSVGGNVSEIFDYGKHLRYLKCIICETSTNNSPMPILFAPAGATAAGTATINGIVTSFYNIPNNPVQRVFIHTPTGNIIRAEFVADKGMVKTMDFTGHTAVAPASYFDQTPWNCPQQKCAKAIDLILVFDESGSIKDPDFQRELDFGATLADFYTFGPDAVQMGLVQFDGKARLTAGLTAVKSNFVNIVRNAKQNKGSTCIACGMYIGWQELRGNRGRTTATKVMITLTDGIANADFQGRNLQSVSDEVKGAGVTCFGIGVGGEIRVGDINMASSVIPGVQTSFPAIPSFSALNTIIQSLATATCVDIPGTQCGPGCRGFCACKGTCVCPSDCDDNDPCTFDACKENVNGAGCFYNNNCLPGAKCVSNANPNGEFCDDHNECTTESCDNRLGCVRKNVTCSNPNPCITSTCNTALGCQERPTDCFASNPRFVELVGTCYVIDCAPEKEGCYMSPIEGTYIDDCGICNGTNACKVPPLPDSVPYALTGGALAAVVIFAVIAAAALGAAGGKTGYNIWMNHRNHISGAQTSPLYSDSGLTGNSPLYKA